MMTDDGINIVQGQNVYGVSVFQLVQFFCEFCVFAMVSVTHLYGHAAQKFGSHRLCM